MERVSPTDAQDLWSIAAEEHRHHADSLLRLAYLATGDAGTAIVAVEDAFVRLLRRRSSTMIDAAGARSSLQRRVLATAEPAEPAEPGGPTPPPDGRPPSDTETDDDPARAAAATAARAVRSLARRQRDAVLLHCHAGLDGRDLAGTLHRRNRAVRRDLDRGLRTAMSATGADDTAALAGALWAHADELDVAPPPWEAIVARAATSGRRQRSHWLAGSAIAAGVLLVTLIAGGGGRHAGSRLALDSQVGLPATTAPPPLGAIVAVLVNGRVVQLDGNDGHMLAEIGLLDGSPLLPGQVDLAVTRTDLYVAARADDPAVIDFSGDHSRTQVASGHSPAVSAGGQLAWVDHEGGADGAVVVRRDGVEHQWPIEPGATVGFLTWAPDDRRLAFELDVPGASPEVRVLDTTSSTDLRDAPRLGPWRSPRWLADGDLVVADVTGTLASIVDPDSLQALSSRLEGAPAAAVDADTRGNLLAVHADGVLTVNGHVIFSSVVAAAWRS